MKSWMNSKSVHIYFRVTSPKLLIKPIFDLVNQHNSFSFDQIFLNLLYKIRLKFNGQLDGEMIQCILL